MDPPRRAGHLVLRRMLHRLRPALEASGDFATVRDLLDETLAAGSAADRLRRTVREADLPAIDLLVTETRGDRLPARAAVRRPRPQVATTHHANGRSRLHPVTAPGTPG